MLWVRLSGPGPCQDFRSHPLFKLTKGPDTMAARLTDDHCLVILNPVQTEVVLTALGTSQINTHCGTLALLRDQVTNLPWRPMAG